MNIKTVHSSWSIVHKKEIEMTEPIHELATINHQPVHKHTQNIQL